SPARALRAPPGLGGCRTPPISPILGAMRWMVRGDIDGFFGLAIDNLIQLLLIDVLCRVVLGFPEDLVYGRILPATAVSLLVGNLYYAREAMRIGRAEGRSNACALPYGINTVSLVAYALLVMLPATLVAESADLADRSRLASPMRLL